MPRPTKHACSNIRAHMPEKQQSGQKRPNWAPEWYNWWPGEDPRDPARLGFTFREAHAADAHQVKRLMEAAGDAVTAETLAKWMTAVDYSVWLCVRNRRYAVGVCVFRTGPDKTTVLFAYVPPRFSRLPILTKFLALAALSLPEAPVVWSVPFGDGRLCVQLRDGGWRCVTYDKETDECTFSFGPCVGSDEEGDEDDTVLEEET